MAHSSHFANTSGNSDYMRNPDVTNAMIESMEARIRELRQGISNQNQNPNMNSNMCHRLYDDNSSKDFRILVGTEEIWLHKCILAVNCPDLAASIGPENHSGGFLSIEGYSPKTIEEFIRFLYKNEISEESERNPEVLTGLIKFGYYYKMDYLVHYSLKLVEIHANRFDKDCQRSIIKMACKLRLEKRILETILGIFKTESFTNEPTISQNQYLNQFHLAPNFGTSIPAAGNVPGNNGFVFSSQFGASQPTGNGNTGFVNSNQFGASRPAETGPGNNGTGNNGFVFSSPIYGAPQPTGYPGNPENFGWNSSQFGMLPAGTQFGNSSPVFGFPVPVQINRGTSTRPNANANVFPNQNQNGHF